ncbi:Ubiquitin-like-conjugating enzyme ATG10 [Aphelenchoides besseyi]|nr:Ubiquitin-like-conjugating enzyme ATG10 [Aphelenchoides besseyi]KAI6194784.1 Ubiquitin-like-conjugating enzyme ATG10 [Aphelenchoides besseyi]
MAMISVEEYTRQLKEFVRLYAESGTTDEPFKMHKDTQWMYAEQRQLVDSVDGKEQAIRLISITYNDAYAVPVLWFNFYALDGRILYLDDFSAFLCTDSMSTSILNGLSQNEHPIHGIAFFNVHPCRTSEMMKNFNTRNYLISWLSVYGAVLRFYVGNSVLQDCCSNDR